MKTATAALILWLMSASVPAASGEKPALLIYLPRDVSVETGTIRLGTVSVVRSADKELAEKARAVPLGRSPWPKEQILLDRQTILSRLACCGIPAAAVNITGAPKVAVTGKQKVISPDTIRNCAESYLTSHPPEPRGCKWRLVGTPEEMVLPVAEGIELKAQPAEDAPRHHVKLKVAAGSDGRELAASQVLFRLVYPTQQAVATKPVAPGQRITPENIKIETVMTLDPPDGSWTPPYGMLSTTSLSAGTVIRPGLVAPAKPAVVVRRNQNVIMRIEGQGFTIAGLGQALQDGRPGEFIKVRNIDSQRVVVAKVAFDGTVRPVFKEEKP
ncbi:MAG: hypothetical protein AMJ81_02460 [Phycisphaerae bacterium SM23_33]|nr:MAG: hypothetical protein AMJ81_02460 [Phycisphaerae bacterium SM23_33]